MKKVMDTTVKTINTTSDSYRRFINDIKRYDVMTPEQEVDAFDRYHKGDESARDDIMNANQRFVLSVAKKYAKTADEILSLVSVGNLGMSIAIDKFDTTLGYRFCSYAVNWINQKINLYLDYQKPMVHRSNEIQIGRKADKIRNKFYAQNGRWPSDTEVVDILESEYDVKVANMTDITECCISSTDATYTDSEDTVMEAGELASKTSNINDYENIIDEDDKKNKVKKLLACLNDKAKTVIKMSYGIDCDAAFDADIADTLCVCETRVQQIRKEAIKQMSKYAKSLAM